MKKMISDRHNFKFNYLIDEFRNIYSSASKKWLKPSLDKNGYYRIRLQNIDGVTKAIPVHRLVMNTFSPHPDSLNLTVNHKDGNKTNNHIDNLEWMTNLENINHAFQNNLRSSRGENNASHKLTELEVYQIIDLLLYTKFIYQEIAFMYDVHEETIARIKRKKSWKHLTTNIVFPKRSTTSRKA